MSARLILARHGNTFKAEDEPVWVGARTDLPLVEKGLAQAQLLADAMQNTHTRPDTIITGPLKRTRETATIIAATLGLKLDQIRIDHRLTEIDYGAWEGKSSSAILAGGDGAELAAWNKDSVFPTNPGWFPTEAQLIADTGHMLEEVGDGLTLIVSSNGILRFFARAAINAQAFPDRKVLTGYICVMDRDPNGVWHIVEWNMRPDLFFQ